MVPGHRMSSGTRRTVYVRTLLRIRNDLCVSVQPPTRAETPVLAPCGAVAHGQGRAGEHWPAVCPPDMITCLWLAVSGRHLEAGIAPLHRFTAPDQEVCI